MIAELAAKFLEIFKEEEVATMDVKQTLSYGLGIFAMHLPSQTFAGLAPRVVEALSSMIQAPDAFSEDNVVATESALGGFGRVIYFQRQAVPDSVVNAFLEKLPLTHEEEEAQKSHKLFLEQVIAGNPSIMGDATKAKALEACLRIKQAAEDQGQGDKLKILCKEGLKLL